LEHPTEPIIIVASTLDEGYRILRKLDQFRRELGIKSDKVPPTKAVSKERFFAKFQEVLAGFDPAGIFVDHAVFDDERVFVPSVQKPLAVCLPRYTPYYAFPRLRGRENYRLASGGGFVHETAYVENSFVGRGVTVGPGSIVIDSTLTGATRVFEADVRHTVLHDVKVGKGSTIYSARVSKSRLENSKILAQKSEPTRVVRCTLDNTLLKRDVYARHVRFENAQVSSGARIKHCLVSETHISSDGKAVLSLKKFTATELLSLKEFFIDEDDGYSYKMSEQDMKEMDVQKSLLEKREAALIQRELQITDREAELGKLEEGLRFQREEAPCEREEIENLHEALEAREKRVQEAEANVVSQLSMSRDLVISSCETADGIAKVAMIQAQALVDLAEEKKTEKNTMSQNNTGYDALKNTGSAMGAAILNGGKMAGANKFNNTIRDLFKRILMRQGFTREELDHPAVNATLKLAAPFILKYATEKFPQIFGGEKIAPIVGSAAEKAMEAAVYEIAMPILEEIGPDLLEIKSQAAALVSDAPRVEEAEEDDVITRTAKVSEREKDPVPASV